MTKDEFATKLANRMGLSKSKARDVIDCIFGTESGHGIIAAELDAGREFGVTGFGKFGTRYRKGRTGRNPQTGDALWIPPMTVPTFTAGKGLKERVADEPSRTQGAGAVGDAPVVDRAPTDTAAPATDRFAGASYSRY